MLGILALCEEGQITLLASEALDYEIRRNPYPLRRVYALAVVAQAKIYLRISAAVEARAGELVKHGLKPLDALHVALAEEGNADYFCTTDDRLLKKARRLPTIKVRVVSPLELAQEIE